MKEKIAYYILYSLIILIIAYLCVTSVRLQFENAIFKAYLYKNPAYKKALYWAYHRAFKHGETIDYYIKKFEVKQL